MSKAPVRKSFMVNNPLFVQMKMADERTAQHQLEAKVRYKLQKQDINKILSQTQKLQEPVVVPKGIETVSLRPTSVIG